MSGHCGRQIRMVWVVHHNMPSPFGDFKRCMADLLLCQPQSTQFQSPTSSWEQAIGLEEMVNIRQGGCQA